MGIASRLRGVMNESRSPELPLIPTVGGREPRWRNSRQEEGKEIMDAKEVAVAATLMMKRRRKNRRWEEVSNTKRG